MAEAMLRHRLVERGIEASVSSAGVATEDQPPTDEVIELLKARGIDATGHRSRLLDPAIVAGSDLIIGMAREHVREVSILEPTAFSRTFNITELVRLAEATGPRRSEQTMGEWLAEVGDERTPAAHLTLADADDIDDPIGRRFGVYKRVAERLDDLLDRLVLVAWPAEPA